MEHIKGESRGEMKKLTLLVLIVFLLAACKSTSSDVSAITLDQVLSALKEQQLTIKEAKSSNVDLLGMKLNGVKPSSYALDGKKLLIYNYPSAKERKKGMEDFRKKTENSNTVSYKYYEVNNVLVFYVYEKDLNMDTENRIQKSMNRLEKSVK